jgi:hypothetical protein
MRRISLSIVFAAVLAACASGQAVAHHQFAAEFDRNQRIELTGIVTHVNWTNPHVWVHFIVLDDEGQAEDWAFEMGPPHALQRRGWRRETLQIGEEISVEGALARDGSNRINASQVFLTATGGEPMDPASSETEGS